MCGRACLSSDVSEIKVAFRIPPERPTPIFRRAIVMTAFAAATSALYVAKEVRSRKRLHDRKLLAGPVALETEQLVRKKQALRGLRSKAVLRLPLRNFAHGRQGKPHPRDEKARLKPPVFFRVLWRPFTRSR